MSFMSTIGVGDCYVEGLHANWPLCVRTFAILQHARPPMPMRIWWGSSQSETAFITLTAPRARAITPLPVAGHQRHQRQLAGIKSNQRDDQSPNATENSPPEARQIAQAPAAPSSAPPTPPHLEKILRSPMTSTLNEILIQLWCFHDVLFPFRCFYIRFR